MTSAADLMKLLADKKASMKRTEAAKRLEAGENRVVILRGWRKNGDPTFFHDFGQHFIKDAADQIKAVHLCTNATYGTECPVCVAISKATAASGDDSVAQVLEKAKASRVVLVNALLLDSKEPNTPVVLELKRGAFEQVIDIIAEYEGAPLDEKEPIILKITREGKGLNTKYTAMPTAKKYALPAAVLEKLNDLDEYVKQDSSEQRQRAIAAVNTVAGIAGPSADRPSTSPARLGGPASGEVLEDIPDLDPIKPAAAAPGLNSDLDDLLSDLPE